MDEQMQQQIVALVQAAMQGDQQAQQQVQQIMQAAQQGDQQAIQIAQMIQAVAQQIQGQQAKKAANGAKLNYIKFLRGKCPDGYEMQYFKKGGQLCKECRKKVTVNEEGGEISDPVSAYKCGRKMVKTKKACGGLKTKPLFRKCGGKQKKINKAKGGADTFNWIPIIPVRPIVGPMPYDYNDNNYNDNNSLYTNVDFTDPSYVTPEGIEIRRIVNNGQYIANDSSIVDQSGERIGRRSNGDIYVHGNESYYVSPASPMYQSEQKRWYDAKKRLRTGPNKSPKREYINSPRRPHLTQEELGN